jgi:hypothetical protein
MASAIRKVVDAVTGRGERQRQKLRKESVSDDLIREEAMKDQPGGPVPSELIQRLEAVYFLGHDDVVAKMVWDDPDLHNFTPALSVLNRTTRFSKDQGELQTLIMGHSILWLRLGMNEDDFENQGVIKLNSLEMYARCVVTDAVGGHRSTLFTRQEKVIRAVVGEAEKKKILP